VTNRGVFGPISIRLSQAAIVDRDPRLGAGVDPSTTGLQRLCLITCGVIFLPIVVGGTVRH
jgi:hypothetical protein